MPPRLLLALAPTRCLRRQRSNVSLTGSFSAISSIGAEPVGDELLDGVEPEDMYIDDADDSAFQSDFTETGAFAGPGYVEMPQSRVGFFGKFRRSRRRKKALPNGSAWVDISTHVKLEKAARWLGEPVTKTFTDGTAAHFRICVHAFWVEANGTASDDAAASALRLR